ncbi:sulfite reductase flavo protein alpha-component [Pseudomassariella vexata]|uniref:NADPH--hemoprotein reductase n=1 Tax=Pseudomassariella vexata TaxID=1141098 RepID=A0A1Y2DVD1_9PEZI|nr:sulfite reductase flavo protein alpha-component [Pseudomassariella vexata]ORY62605.1 sulfite reductase flavo protein alpha-component [Pseudomassariella vexata]
MSERSCPVSGSAGGRCPAGMHGLPSAKGSTKGSRIGPRGCSFSGFTQPGDVRTAFNIPNGVETEDWLRLRERKAINEILYSDIPTIKELNETTDIDGLTANEHDLLAVALGAPARQVIIRAEEVGPQSGWRDGWLSAEYGFVPPDPDETVNALANTPGRVWSDLCERMPGCVSRGRVRESVAALPLIEGTEDVIPDDALWAALVALGLLCSIYRYEDKHDGHEGVSMGAKMDKPKVEMSDDILEEVKGIPKTIGLPYVQISKRMGRPLPHLTFVDQSSYNVRIRDPKSVYPYVGRFDNMDLRWPMFGDQSEIAFLKGCADTSASFQHGPDAIASCQEHVMNRNVEGLLREMIRLKEILERMPAAFHTISPNPSSGENFVSADEWVRWAKFSAPLSKRCPASSGLQFPPYLLMDAFLGRKKYGSFLGAEGIHLRAWQPSNLRAFIAAVEYHYSVPEFVAKSGDPRLMGVFDGIVEAYTGERGFMGVHRYKVFGILEVAAKTGRTETNGASGQAGAKQRPWEETHKQFSEAMKERLEPYRGNIAVEPHQMRGTFEECRYKTRILSRSFVDNDVDRSISMVTLDIQDTGITFQPGDRLAIMPLNTWEECAKVALALGFEDMLDTPISLNQKWSRFAEHLGSVSRKAVPKLSIRDIMRRGHLAPLTQELVLKVHHMLRASSNVVLQVLATDEWPVRGSLGDLLQAAVADTPSHVWDQAFDLTGSLGWLGDLIDVEIPRTYSISSYPDELLPSTVDLTISRAEYDVCSTFAGQDLIKRSGVSSGFLNPPVTSSEELMPIEEEILVGVSRPVAFQLPLDGAAPCAFFAGGSGIAPFRSFWQSRIGRTVGRNILYLGVQSREKFCYEQELREYVNNGQMEVHTAFSRDSRGLVYDRYSKDLVEKNIPPRYIDTLIAEQGETVCDLVMSKKQGGLGGYLYICGSVSVFDSVMAGLRKAIYNHRTATMESTDVIINSAFAERRIMLDVFMTPKPLPCNLPTIPQSQLALHTGHRPDSRMWIGVHGKVYDITDFCPMHPGGTLIIKSNAGVDCSRSFDNLAHTNNPEVASLLTKYFIGHLTPKPDYHGIDELSGLYDMWLDYTRTVVETLVAHQFEMNKLMGNDMGTSIDSSTMWFQGSMISVKGVRSFYQYQSRLLQGGFSAMFGPKFQELILKLSFSLANSAPDGASTRLPDVLGVIGRAKTSEDAINTSKQVSLIGEFIRDSESARFHERGIMSYASKSVELDIALLEDIRQEACYGMDAFDSISELDDSTGNQAVVAISTFLMQVLERMAKRLEIFYSNLAQHSIYKPEIERNPARSRWHLLRQRIRDGSFFILTQDTVLGAAPSYMPQKAQNTVDFDRVISQIQQTLTNVPKPGRATPTPRMDLNQMHTARTQQPKHGASAFESHENATALGNMSSFVDKNMRAIRRLSKMPPMPISLEALANHPSVTGIQAQPDTITPPSSRGSSRSPNRIPMGHTGVYPRSHSPPLTANEAMSAYGFNRRMDNHGHSLSSHQSMQHHHYPATPPLDPASAINSMMGKLNVRPRANASRATTPVNMMGHSQSVRSSSADGRARAMHMRQLSAGQPFAMVPGQQQSSRTRSATSTSGGSLRTFRLVQQAAQGHHHVQKVTPTF